jgi:hypothetical protein
MSIPQPSAFHSLVNGQRDSVRVDDGSSLNQSD